MQSLIRYVVLIAGFVSLLAFTPVSYRLKQSYNKSILSSKIKNDDSTILNFSFVKATFSLALALKILNPSATFADDEKDAKRVFESCYSQCKSIYHYQ